MNYLLKIVEGPMKGAEVALVAGTRIKVGSGDACDVVVADAALAETAFELDVTDSAVTMILPDGDAKTLHPFEIQSFGTTEVALGPAEGAWEPLVRPAPPAEEKPAEAAKEPEGAEEAKPAEAEAAPAAAEPAAADDASAQSAKKRNGILACAVLAALALLFVVVAVAFLWLWPRMRPYVVEDAENASFVDKAAARFADWRGKWFSKSGVVDDARAGKKLTLAEIAEQNGLVLETKDGRPLLKGNLKLRTERNAVRALALAADRTCQFDLADDESLREAVDALLFLVTEGAIQASAVTNRVASLKGFARTPADLSAVIRAISTDVVGISRIDTSSVKTGAPDGRMRGARRILPTPDAKRVPASDEVAAAAQKSAEAKKDAGGPPPAKLPEQTKVDVQQMDASLAAAITAANKAAELKIKEAEKAADEAKAAEVRAKAAEERAKAREARLSAEAKAKAEAEAREAALARAKAAEIAKAKAAEAAMASEIAKAKAAEAAKAKAEIAKTKAAEEAKTKAAEARAKAAEASKDAEIARTKAAEAAKTKAAEARVKAAEAAKEAAIANAKAAEAVKTKAAEARAKAAEASKEAAIANAKAAEAAKTKAAEARVKAAEASKEAEIARAKAAEAAKTKAAEARAKAAEAKIAELMKAKEKKSKLGGADDFEEISPFEIKARNGTFVGLPEGRRPSDYPPIAGILTVPYPCVVMASGLRCVYGAHVGRAEIVEIRADAIVLEENDVQFMWIP